MEFIKLLLNEENVRMQYEIAAMLLLLMLSAIKEENRKRLANYRDNSQSEKMILMEVY